MKLKNSILALLLLFTLIPLGIFGVFSIYETSCKINELTERNLRAISDNQIMNIQNFAQDRSNEMEMIANYQLIQDAILYSLGEKDAVSGRRYVDSLLRERKKYGTFVASISVLDRNFRVVGSSEEYQWNSISQMKNIDSKFQKGDFIIGNVYARMTDDGKKNIVPAYIGVYNEDELIGYVAEELDTAYFDSLRLNMDSLCDGTFYILDGNGAIITAGDTKQESSLTTFVTKSADRNDFQEKWNALDREKYPSGELHYSYQGQEYITYYSDVEHTDWGIRVSENLTAQKETAKTYKMLISLVLAALAGGLFCAQNFIAKKILAPINEVLEVFAKIKQSGDYSLRIDIHTNNETGQLAGGINELLAYVEEADQQKKLRQKELQQMAERDSLTGIKNKKAIEKEMLAMVHRAAETGEQLTMGFVDIDDFRNYNTNYGHQEGDAVIRFVGQMLEQHVGGAAGRVGGDEFAFCYVGALTPEQLRQRAQTLLEKLHTEHINIETHKVQPVPCSIGIVMAQGERLDYTELIKKADQAMYQAKENGKNTFVLLQE